MKRYRIEIEGGGAIECESRMDLTEFLKVLNDEREFIPFREVGAEIVIVPKGKILAVRTSEI